jgi:hypothetical protein
MPKLATEKGERNEPKGISAGPPVTTDEGFLVPPIELQ